jgi:hypothetical protein
MRSPLALVFALSPLLLASCTVSVKTTADLPEPAPTEAAGSPVEGAPAPTEGAADSERKEAEAARKAAVAEREVRHARMELELAELEAALSMQSARAAVESAEVKLMAARERVERFEGIEVEHLTEQTRMGVDRAEDRLIGEQQDLQGILDIYAEEQEARSRDEIIRRHRMSVLFAERGLEGARRAHALQVEHELPARMRELERGVVEAEQGLEAARGRLRKQELQNERDLDRKRAALEDAEWKQAHPEAAGGDRGGRRGA